MDFWIFWVLFSNLYGKLPPQLAGSLFLFAHFHFHCILVDLPQGMVGGGSSSPSAEPLFNEIPEKIDFFSHHPWRCEIKYHFFFLQKTLFSIEGHLELHQCILAAESQVETPVAAHQMLPPAKGAVVLEAGIASLICMCLQK